MKKISAFLLVVIMSALAVFAAGCKKEDAISVLTLPDKCAFYGVQCYKTEFSSEELGNAVGKMGAVCALGVTDSNFSNELTTLNLKEKR